MTMKLFSAAAAGLAFFVGASASATSLPEQISMCAAAVDHEGIASMDEYRPEFVRARGASAKRLTIELVPHADGDVLTAECKIRRGQVEEVVLKS